VWQFSFSRFHSVFGARITRNPLFIPWPGLEFTPGSVPCFKGGCKPDERLNPVGVPLHPGAEGLRGNFVRG